jgi:hypothetical protein
MNEIQPDNGYVNMTGVAVANFYAGSGDTLTSPLNPSSIDEKFLREKNYYTVEKTFPPSFVRVRINPEDEIRSFYLLMQAIPIYCLRDGTYLIPSSSLQELDKLNIVYETC